MNPTQSFARYQRRRWAFAKVRAQKMNPIQAFPKAADKQDFTSLI